MYGVAADAQLKAVGLGSSGADRDRTCDPLVANQVLSQLSYSPTISCRLSVPSYQSNLLTTDNCLLTTVSSRALSFES